MKINATLVKEDGLYGMVMPEKPVNCIEGGFSICPQDKGKPCLCNFEMVDYEAVLQVARDAAIRYEDQEAAKALLPKEAFTRKIDDRSIYVIPGVYPLPEPLEVEQIWQYKWAGTPSENWQDCNDNDPRSTHNGKYEYRATLRISQGTDNNDDGTNVVKTLSEMYGPSAFESHLSTNTLKVVVEEKKEPERMTVDNTPKFTEANKFRMKQWSDRDRDKAIRFLHSLDKHDIDAWRKLFEIIKSGIASKIPGTETEEKILSQFYLIEQVGGVSEREEPTQEELWKEVIAGQSMEDLLKRFTITRRA